MAIIKRPAVILAAFFVLSAYLSGVGLSAISLCLALALLPIFLFWGMGKRQNRRAFFIFLLIFALLYPSVFKSFSETRKEEFFELFKDRKSFTATVNGVSYRGKNVFVYADIYGENKRNMGKAVFTKTAPDRIPDLYDNIYFEGDIYPVNRETVEKLSLFGDENYYFADNCYLAADVDKMTVLGRGKDANLIHKYYFYITDNLKNIVTIFDGTDPFSYISALLTGNRAFIKSETSERFSRSGLIPYLCISGLHVSIATGILIYFLKLFRVKRVFRAVFAALLLLFICFITGFSGSVMRASFMTASVFLSDILKVNSDRFSALATALCGVLIFNPFAVFDVGTQLSFVAMTGLCNGAFFMKNDSVTNCAFYEKVKRIIVVSTLTTGFVLIPLLHSFSGAFLFSPIANIPAVIFTPIMYLATFLGVFAFLPKVILYPIGNVFSFLAVIFERLSSAFAEIPYSYAQFSCPALLSYLFIFLLSFNVICISTGKETDIAFSGVFLCLVSYISVFIMHIMTIFCN